MVNNKTEPLDQVFAALMDGTRRELLARLADGSHRTVSELAQPFRISLPAVMKHLDVLAAAGLVKRSKSGRVVTCSLEAQPLRQATDWLQSHLAFWTASFDRLEQALENDAWQPDPTPPSPSPSSAASGPRPKRSTPRGPGRPR